MALVKFYYMNGCHYCKEFMPEYQQIKHDFDGQGVEFAEYEASQDRDIVKRAQFVDKAGQPKRVRGFPTVTFTGPDGVEHEINRTDLAKLVATFCQLLHHHQQQQGDSQDEESDWANESDEASYDENDGGGQGYSW
jgi:thiol-disulfide isomerase/thioredoxin